MDELGRIDSANADRRQTGDRRVLESSTIVTKFTYLSLSYTFLSLSMRATTIRASLFPYPCLLTLLHARFVNDANRIDASLPCSYTAYPPTLQDLTCLEAKTIGKLGLFGCVVWLCHIRAQNARHGRNLG